MIYPTEREFGVLREKIDRAKALADDERSSRDDIEAALYDILRQVDLMKSQIIARKNLQ